MRITPCPQAPGEPHVLASAASGVIGMIDGYGGDVDRIFGRAHLDAEMLDSPLNELCLRQYCRLFEEAARDTQYDNFGLRFGYAFKPEQLGALGYLAINSPTLKAALRNLADYFPAHQQNSTFAMHHEKGLVRLDYQITDGRIMERRQDAELSLGMFCNIFRHCLGQRWRPIQVRFEHPEPIDRGEHETLFDAPVYFSQPTNSLLFRRTDLDSVMPGHDSYLFSLIEVMLRAKNQRSRDTDDLISQVRHRIEEQFRDGSPQLGAVASKLGTTSWTLQRRLRELNVTFNDLVRNVRRDLAMNFVSEPHIPLTEVALLLGYSELSALSRAFRHWTGMAPATYRRGHAKSMRHDHAPATPEWLQGRPRA